MSILMLPKAIAILKLYKDYPKCIRKKVCLPVPSNQVYNRSLKKITEFLDFSFGLTTHIARHTFATTVTLNNDVPIETVSDMLGHKSIRTTQSYSKVKEMKIKRDMKNLQKKFEPNNNSILRVLR
ncbi:site-specific tyrosine recombinase XerC [compost metagenome]